MNAFDILIIGSGPGGYVAAIRAAQLGKKVAIIERDALGGVCLNWGCIPTKALLKSAQVYQYLLEAEKYGLKAKKVEFDFEKIIHRSRNIAETMNKGIKFLLQKNKVQVIEGYGKIKPGRRVEVTNDKGEIIEYKAEHIIIATGGRSKPLASLAQDNKIIFDYKKALSLDTLPEKMVIVGAGAIGCEFACFYQSLGVQVILIEYANRIVPNEDAEVSLLLEKSFSKMGIQVLTSTRVITSKVHNKRAVLLISTAKGEEEIVADMVLSAAGIVANIDNIGLEHVGIEIKEGKIKTDAYYQTNIEGYYAIGDVTTGQSLAHVASAEGIVCVENIAGYRAVPINYNNIPACTYTFPEIASVGYTEQKAKEMGYEILIGKFPFSASGKAQAAGHSDGFVKIIIDKKYGEIFGAHMIGFNVTEMIAEIVLARHLESTGKEILNAVHPHPTMSEAIMEATAAAYGEVIHL
ncbi:MAG: dihydrolipoyl dehydrogenase [Chitinophagales bacterium]|nr:dihydrolipoyl dehydrogenase [Chitinophagales bacterium]